MGQERRQHPRIPLSVDVDFFSGNNFFTGRTRNISIGGLFIETAVALPVGTELSIELQLLEAKKLTVLAEVTWELLNEDGKPIGVGVRFADLDAEARRTIDEFMELREPMEFDVQAREESPGPPPLPADAKRPAPK